MSNIEEIWKDVKGYEGKYLVSSGGKIKSLIRNLIMSQATTNGYHRLTLIPSNGGKCNESIHRIVCQAFIGDIPLGMQVNHKNGIKTDNRLENLEIVTPKYNINHAFKLGLIKRIRPSYAKKVIDTKTGQIFNTVDEARIHSGLSPSTINRFLKGTWPNKTSLKYLSEHEEIANKILSA